MTTRSNCDFTILMAALTDNDDDASAVSGLMFFYLYLNFTFMLSFHTSWDVQLTHRISTSNFFVAVRVTNIHLTLCVCFLPLPSNNYRLYTGCIHCRNSESFETNMANCIHILTSVYAPVIKSTCWSISAYSSITNFLCCLGVRVYSARMYMLEFVTFNPLVPRMPKIKIRKLASTDF